jgi:hypothetical protein
MTHFQLSETLCNFHNCSFEGHLLYAQSEDCMAWWQRNNLMYDGVEWSHVAQGKGPVVGSCDQTMKLQVTQTQGNFLIS